MATPPLKLKRALALSALGVPSSALTFATATLPSDRLVTVHAAGELLVLDTADPGRPSRRPLAAEGAALHPGGRLLAMRVGVNLRVVDVVGKREVARAVIPEPVLFWRWVDGQGGLLGIVTAAAVYHWEVG
jgi:hypothetical protein